MSAWTKIERLRDRVACAPIVEVREVQSLDPEEAVKALAESGFKPERLIVLGWELFLSRRRTNGAVIWHLSSMLHPHGRSATEHDWKILGRIAARVGAPPDPVVVPEDARAAHHWSWIESSVERLAPEA